MGTEKERLKILSATQPVKMVASRQANVQAVYPAEESGQLPFLVSKRMSFDIS